MLAAKAWNKQMDDNTSVISTSELFQLLLSAILYAGFVFVVGDLAILLQNTLNIGVGISSAIGSVIYIASLQVYFFIRGFRPQELDPYTPKKLYSSVIILLIIFLTYDVTNRSQIKTAMIAIFSFLCLFYFRRYLEGVAFRIPVDVVEANAELDTLEYFIKGNWAGAAGFLFVDALLLRYLIFVEHLSPNPIFLLVSDLGFYWPIIVFAIYFNSIKYLSPPMTQNVRPHLCRFYSYAEQYPMNTHIRLLEKFKTKIQSIGGWYSVRIIRIIQEKDLKSGLTNWEEKYKENAKDAFWYYFLVAYATPIIWFLTDSFPTQYVIVPPYDLGLYGLSILFAGSLFLGLESISDVPGTEQMKEVKLTVYSHLGVLLLATGTMFQISSEVDAGYLFSRTAKSKS